MHKSPNLNQFSTCKIHEKLKNEIQSRRNKEYTVLVNNINQEG